MSVSGSRQAGEGRGNPARNRKEGGNRVDSEVGSAHDGDGGDVVLDELYCCGGGGCLASEDLCRGDPLETRSLAGGDGMKESGRLAKWSGGWRR